MAKLALVFPGQGAQAVGMGLELANTYPEAREILEQFNTWTGLPDLTRVMAEGPEETLKQTLYTQPAILAVSLAAYAVLSSQVDLQPVFAAGHSLGEYGALVAAGVLDVESAARLIAERARQMANAPSGAMAAVLGLAEDKVAEAVAQAQAQNVGQVVVANYNTPEQVVLSGEPAAVAAASEAAKALGALKVIPLVVGGAFHSPLMQAPSAAFDQAMPNVMFSEARFPVITNVDAKPTTASDAFRPKLVAQIHGAVRWTDTMRYLQAQGVTTYVELGPGKVLSGMLKKFDRAATVLNVSDAQSLEAAVAALRQPVSVS